MANNCNFDMQIVGKKPAVEEFVQLLKWQVSDEQKGIGRVYSAQVYEKDESEDLVKYFVDGDCAWTVYEAMMAEGTSRFPSLESESKRLNLAIEVFSVEPGVGLQEHYVIVKGRIIVDECVGYKEFVSDHYNNDNIEEAITEFCRSINISREEFNAGLDEDGVYGHGGLGDNYLDYCDLTKCFKK